MVLWVLFHFLLLICLIPVGVKGIYYGFKLCLSDYVLFVICLLAICVSSLKFLFVSFLSFFYGVVHLYNLLYMAACASWGMMTCLCFSEGFCMTSRDCYPRVAARLQDLNPQPGIHRMKEPSGFPATQVPP